MKINYKRGFILISLLSMLILSLGMVSASNNGLEDSNNLNLEDSDSFNLVSSDYNLINSNIYGSDLADSNLNDGSAYSKGDSSAYSNRDDSAYSNTDDYADSNLNNSFSDDSIDSSKKSKSSLEDKNIPKYGVNVIIVEHTGNDARDIQNAINLSKDGDYINLGEYAYNIGYAQLNITKNITFRGEGNNTVIFGYGYTAGTDGNNSRGCILDVKSSGTVIEGIQFSNINPNLQYTDWDTLYGWALKVEANAKNVLISDCSFINFNHGIYSAADSTKISDCYFTGTATRIMSSKTSGNGKERGTKCVHLEEANKCIITNNVFDGTVLDAILLEYGCRNTVISNNQFLNNAYSIYLYGADLYYDAYYNVGTVIKNNTFYNCGRFDADYYGSKMTFTHLPIISGQETYLVDLAITGNNFVLNNESTIMETLEDDPSYIGGNITFKDNDLSFLNDAVSGDTIVIFDYEAGLMTSLNLYDDIRFVNNTLGEGIITAIFYDYLSDSYDYWTSYLGDLILPASYNYTNVHILADSVYAGDSSNVKVRFYDANSNPLNGTLKFFVDDGKKVKVYNITVEDGEGSYVLKNLSEGSYYIGVGFGGNSSYNPSMDVQTFNVSRKESNLNIFIKNNRTFTDESLVLNINLFDDEFNSISGELLINFKDSNGNIVNSFNYNTTGRTNKTFALGSLLKNKTGDYIVEAIFQGDNKFLPSNDTLSFNVASRNVLLNILAPESVVSGNPFNISFTLTDLDKKPLDAVIELIIGDLQNNITINEGYGIFNHVLLEKGTYTIHALFNDEVYGNASDYSEIEVLGKSTEISISIIKNNNVNHTAHLNLSSVDGKKLSGAVAVEIDNKLYDVAYLEKGIASLVIDDIFVNGNHNLTARYYGDNVYSGCENSKSFTISFDEDDSYIKVNHTGNDLADLQRAIDSANTGDIINLGSYVYSGVSNLNITRDISIISQGATIFTAGNAKPIFNVLSDDIRLNISSVKFLCSNNDTIVSSNQSNDLFVLTNNTLDLSKSSVNPESVSLLYIGSGLDDAFKNGLIINSNNLIAGMKVVSLLNVPDEHPDANGSDADVNGTGNNKTDTNGTGADNKTNGTDVNGTSPDNKTNGTGDNNQCNGSDIGIVKKLSQIVYSDMITTSIDTKVDGRAGEYFQVKLADSNGNPLKNKFIQIGFNGVIYNRTTNGTGNARLQINLKNSGFYTFAVCFLGDEEYNGSFIVAKITVNKQKAKLTTSNKSYKSNAKTKTLTATFKTAKGNPLSGKTIKFTVNGKTYSAKTNANGVASVKVSLSTKKTYAFTAKFAGDDSYAALSVSAKVTIK